MSPNILNYFGSQSPLLVKSADRIVLAYRIIMVMPLLRRHIFSRHHNNHVALFYLKMLHRFTLRFEIANMIANSDQPDSLAGVFSVV